MDIIQSLGGSSVVAALHCSPVLFIRPCRSLSVAWRNDRVILHYLEPSPASYVKYIFSGVGKELFESIMNGIGMPHDIVFWSHSSVT